MLDVGDPRNDAGPVAAEPAQENKSHDTSGIMSAGAAGGNSGALSCDDLPTPVAFVKSITDKGADRRALTWAQLRQTVAENPPLRKSKADCELFVAGVLGDHRGKDKDGRDGKGALRNADNLQSLSVVVGDYDAGEVNAGTARMRLMAAGVESFIYTSASHLKDKPRYRVVAPIGHAVSPADHLAMVGKLNAILRGILAQESFTAVQPWYFGRVEGVEYKFLRVSGKPLDQIDIEPVYPENLNRPGAGKAATPAPTASTGAAGAADPDDFMAGAAPPMSAEILADMRSAAMFLAQKGGIADYQAWMRVCLILKSAAYGEYAEPLRLLWHEASAQDDRYDRDQAEGKWQSCAPTRIKPASLFAMAKDEGWQNPRSKPTVEALVAGVADLKARGHSPEQIVHQTVEKLMLARVDGVGDELVLKALRDATGVSLADEIRDAIGCLQANYLHGAAWRLADASVGLRHELKGFTVLEGFDEPTSRGAILGGDDEQLAPVLADLAGAAPAAPQLPTSRDTVIGLLSEAADLIEADTSAPAAWRVADASVLMRMLLEADGADRVEGFDWRTGRDALLGGTWAQLAAVMA